MALVDLVENIFSFVFLDLWMIFLLFLPGFQTSQEYFVTQVLIPQCPKEFIWEVLHLSSALGIIIILFKISIWKFLSCFGNSSEVRCCLPQIIKAVLLIILPSLPEKEWSKMILFQATCKNQHPEISPVILQTYGIFQRVFVSVLKLLTLVLVSRAFTNPLPLCSQEQPQWK